MLLFMVGLMDVLVNDAHIMLGTPLMLLVFLEVCVECGTVASVCK